MQRTVLWSDIDSIADNMKEPWLITKDFNSVISFKVRIGGNDVSVDMIVDFKRVY